MTHLPAIGFMVWSRTHDAKRKELDPAGAVVADQSGLVILAARPFECPARRTEGYELHVVVSRRERRGDPGGIRTRDLDLERVASWARLDDGVSHASIARSPSRDAPKSAPRRCR